MMNKIHLFLALSLSFSDAFIPSTRLDSRSICSSSSSSPSALFEVIRADVVEQEFDTGLGGVRLAQESSIKISGEVRHRPGNAEARALDLTRYTQLTPIEVSKVQDIFGMMGSKILATGEGKELYRDPGNSIESFIQLAPLEAAKVAVNTAASAIGESTIIFNFLGGDDLILGQVLDATNEAVVNMDVATKAKVFFNSMSDSSIPADVCSVSVIAVGDKESESSSSRSGIDDAIAAGEIYSLGGKWFTVDKANMNNDIA